MLLFFGGLGGSFVFSFYPPIFSTAGHVDAARGRKQSQVFSKYRWSRYPPHRDCLSALVWLFVLLGEEHLTAAFRNQVPCVETRHVGSCFFFAQQSWNPHGKFPFKVAESAVHRRPSRAPPSLLHLKCQCGEIDKKKKNCGVCVREAPAFSCLTAPN